MELYPASEQEEINRFVGAAHGDLDTVRTMLKANPTLLNRNTSWQETAIQAAAQTGQVAIAEHLLALGAPLDICTAAMLGLQDKVQKFLENDPGLALACVAHDIPVLYFPIIRGHRGIAELLLSAGADLNGGEGGTTPLHGAVLFSQVEMVDWMLEHGVKLELKNYDGKTALELALASTNHAIVERLETYQDTE